MSSEKELLIKFCSAYETNPTIAARILEQGIEKVIANSHLISKCRPLPAASLSLPVTALTYLDDNYPPSLFDLADELPLVLWYRSDLAKPDFTKFTLSIIGSNHPSLSDIRLLGNLLAHTYLDYLPITDLSPGIGETLLNISIRNKVPVAVVAAAGLDKYLLPLTSRQRRKFLHQGLLITELPPHIELNRSRLLRRNRIIAALSKSVIALRPPKISAASSIINWADQLGRNVHVI